MDEPLPKRKRKPVRFRSSEPVVSLRRFQSSLWGVPPSAEHPHNRNVMALITPITGVYVSYNGHWARIGAVMNVAQWWCRVTAILFAGWVAFTAGVLVACLPQAAGFKRSKGAGRG